MGCIEMNQARTTSQWWGGLFSLIALVMAFAATSANADFCFRDSYPRDAGTVPNACADNDRAMDEGLCYKKCPAGWDGKATNCVQNCPSGFRDDGLFCAKPAQPAPYGVGAGYAWKGGDPAFNYDKAGDRCRAAHPEGCTRDGLIWYPNCKAGFHKSGALICSPNEIKCPGGWADIGVSCAKPTNDRGVGKLPDACTGGKVLQGASLGAAGAVGLCYNACKVGYSGLGPGCIQSCTPPRGTTCGVVGCAASQSDCTTALAAPVMSVVTFIAREFVMDPLKLTKEAAIELKNKIIAAAGRSAGELAQLSRMQLIDWINGNAAKAGAQFTREEVEALASAIKGQDFDVLKLNPASIKLVANAYRAPQKCPA
jgi:hypothetical protein